MTAETVDADDYNRVVAQNATVIAERNMRISELEAQRDAAGNEGMRLAARNAELEAALRSVPRYAFPGAEELWARIDALLGDTTLDREGEHG